MRLIIAITGASGAVLGIRLLEVLRGVSDVETHLVVTRSAEKVIGLETDLDLAAVRSLADRWYGEDDIAAPIASGTFPTGGMAIVPCSIKTLSAAANSYADSLVARAVDVTLKERRPLVAVVRESPLHLGHLELMARLTRIGGIVMPPVPALYLKPRSLDDLVDHLVGRILDTLGVPHQLFTRWGESPPHS